MKEYKIGQVFEDTENFNPSKRLKCVSDTDAKRFNPCERCEYLTDKCGFVLCYPIQRKDGRPVHFEETTEPITEP